MATGGHCGVFGGHAKGIPAHRVQNIVPCGQFITRDYVAHGVVAHVAHMDATGRVGEHFQHIVFRLGFVALGFEHLGLVPGGLPFCFDFIRGVAGHVIRILDMETPDDLPGVVVI